METKNVLPEDRSEISQTYRGILKEPGTMEEKNLAIHTVAMTKFGGAENFKMKRRPQAPRGYDHAIIDYRTRAGDTDKRAKAWKEIQEEFGGYLKAQAEVDTENESNIHFLKECRASFQKANNQVLAAKVDDLLRDYQVGGYQT